MALNSNKSKPWRVVITRPQVQAEPWAAQLQQLDFRCEQLNLLAIDPLTDAEQARAIQNRIMDFDLYQKAIFVSQNAVRYGLEWLDRYWPQLPLGIEYYAVGATTARALADEGLRVVDLAQSETGSMTSERLLEAPGLQSVAGEKILIFRGLGGRGHLAQILRERGAQVDYCELYQRQLPAAAAEQLERLLGDQLQWQSYTNVIALHSGESLQNLLRVTERLPEPQAKILRGARILVPGERVADLARVAGFGQLVCAENATDQAMSRALCEARQKMLSDC